MKTRKPKTKRMWAIAVWNGVEWWMQNTRIYATREGAEENCCSDEFAVPVSVPSKGKGR